MTARALATAVLATVLTSGCGDGNEPADVCTGTLRVRLPDPNPLTNPLADLARVSIEREGQQVFDQTVDLFAVGSGGIVVEIVDKQTGEPPAIEPSDDLRLSLSAYPNTSTVTAALGRTSRFACPAAEQVSVPLYLGPANGLASTPEVPLTTRIGATATALSDGRVLIVGGSSAAVEAPATPGAAIYDHATGRFCSVADGCLTSDIPPRVDHTATLLENGSVLIVGGRTPGSTAAIEEGSADGPVWSFDAGSMTFTQITLAGVPTLPRARHAAVLVTGERTGSLSGKLLLVGGCALLANTAAASGCPGNVRSDLVVVDPHAPGGRSIIPSSPIEIYSATATLVSGGEVVIAGGSDESGAPVPDVHLFYADNETFARPNVACPSGSDNLCAARAGHTATLLGDGNVLFVGGRTAAGVTEPGAEVFVLAYEKVIRAAAASIPPRRGHAATPLACPDPPCPVLITGGEDPTAQPARAALFDPGPMPSETADFYDGAWAEMSAAPPQGQRAAHAAAALPDGTVLVTGGADPVQPREVGAAVFTFCVPATGLTCPGF